MSAILTTEGAQVIASLFNQVDEPSSGEELQFVWITSSSFEISTTTTYSELPLSSPPIPFPAPVPFTNGEASESGSGWLVDYTGKVATVTNTSGATVEVYGWAVYGTSSHQVYAGESYSSPVAVPNGSTLTLNPQFTFGGS